MNFKLLRLWEAWWNVTWSCSTIYLDSCPPTLTQLSQFSSQPWKALQRIDPGSVFSGLWYSLGLLEHLKLGAITVLRKNFQNKILEWTTSSYYFQNILRESKKYPIIPIQIIRWWRHWGLLCARHSCKDSRPIDHLTSAVLWRIHSNPPPYYRRKERAREKGHAHRETAGKT